MGRGGNGCGLGEVGGVWTGEGVGSGLKNGVNILIPNVNSDVGIGNSSDIDLSEVKLNCLHGREKQ